MKDRTERWFILPFSLGCASKSSVADCTSDANNATPTSRRGRQKGSSIVKKSKHTLGFSLPKPNLSRGIQRLIRSLKSVSQLFVYKDEIKEEVEMEIGYPTDVKHLTHIGWDGSTTLTNPSKGWENLTPSEIISFPSISLKQFELAMTAQAETETETETETDLLQ